MISFHKRISYSVSAILTQCTYTITTYLLKQINYCTINKGSILLYSKGMTGEIQIAVIPFFIPSPSKGVPAGFIGFIEIEHMCIKTIYTITPCVF